jgi:hypothetical protein
MQCHSIISFKWNLISKKNSILAGSAEYCRDQVGIREEGSAHNLIPIPNRSEAPQCVYPSKLFIYVKKSNQDLESRETRFELLI